MTQRAASVGVRKQRGRPKKDIGSGWAGFEGKARRVYLDWWGCYENSRQQLGLGDREARGAASKIVAHRNSLSIKQVQNIVKEGNQRQQSLDVRGEAKSKEMNASAEAFRQMYAPIERAVRALDTPAYRDLLAQCSLVPHVKRPTPRAMGAFNSSEEATGPDSLQRLTAVLAEAFVRAQQARASAEAGLKKIQTRDAADYVSPAYSSQKRLSETKIRQKR